ncbi:MAG: twin-arginine translocase TatA/TatE family subunit [Planctomycetota bacterium]|jgi:sec-independent protein translocase protein TatA|nr:twin-arginine translocase TatA/TatE family subunit [Planctomycetota bacterium]
MTQTIPLAFFSMPGGYEWLIIGLVALLLFGKRLPGVAKSLGQAMHEFKSGLSGHIDADSEKKESGDKKDDPDTSA